MTRALTSLAGGALLMLTALSGVASAQAGSAGSRQPLGRRGQALREPPAGQAADRERRVRQAIATTVRRRLNLDDQKMRSLQQVDSKYTLQRRLLLRDERGARLSLRAALEDSTAANDAKIAQHMDELTQVMRRRVDLLEAEQKELSGFLSPRQRAQYLALREQLTKRFEQLEAGTGAARGGRRGLPPPER
jgi:hypothetical protein